MYDDIIEDSELKKENEKLKNTINELQEFAIWMTGCGYDFCKHEYFCKQRDKLLKVDLY